MPRRMSSYPWKPAPIIGPECRRRRNTARTGGSEPMSPSNDHPTVFLMLRMRRANRRETACDEHNCSGQRAVIDDSISDAIVGD